jgi:DNA-binding MarR family transcriptional regulator
MLIGMSDSPPHLNLGRLFLNAFRWLEAGFDARMERLGHADVKRSTSLVFPYILEGGARAADIARQAGVSRQAIHEVVADLRAQGLVDLEPDPTDRRARLIVLTDRGRAFDADIGRVIAEIEEELAGRIGARRLAALRRALEADWGEPSTD